MEKEVEKPKSIKEQLEEHIPSLDIVLEKTIKAIREVEEEIKNKGE